MPWANASSIAPASWSTLFRGRGEYGSHHSQELEVNPRALASPQRRGGIPVYVTICPWTARARGSRPGG